MVKNLTSTHRHTADNNVFVVFDLLGYSVKDLNKCNSLYLCRNVDDLYHVLHLTSTSTNMTTLPITFIHAIDGLVIYKYLSIYVSIVFKTYFLFYKHFVVVSCSLAWKTISFTILYFYFKIYTFI